MKNNRGKKYSFCESSGMFSAVLLSLYWLRIDRSWGLTLQEDQVTACLCCEHLTRRAASREVPVISHSGPEVWSCLITTMSTWQKRSGQVQKRLLLPDISIWSCMTVPKCDQTCNLQEGIVAIISKPLKYHERNLLESTVVVLCSAHTEVNSCHCII